MCVLVPLHVSCSISVSPLYTLFPAFAQIGGWRPGDLALLRSFTPLVLVQALLHALHLIIFITLENGPIYMAMNNITVVMHGYQCSTVKTSQALRITKEPSVREPSRTGQHLLNAKMPRK